MTESEWEAACKEQALRREGAMDAFQASGWASDLAAQKAQMMFPDPPRPAKRRERMFKWMNYRLAADGKHFEMDEQGRGQWHPCGSVEFIRMLADLLAHPNEGDV